YERGGNLTVKRDEVGRVTRGMNQSASSFCLWLYQRCPSNLLKDSFVHSPNPPPSSKTLIPCTSSYGSTRRLSLSKFTSSRPPNFPVLLPRGVPPEITSPAGATRFSFSWKRSKLRRRLRVQHYIKMVKDIDEACEEESNEMPDIPSTIPFLMSQSCDTKDIEAALPHNQVDPIVASFSGGAVGVISALMLIVLSNKRRKGATTAMELFAQASKQHDSFLFHHHGPDPRKQTGNHGRSAEIEGLNPPHDLVKAAQDLAHLVKSQGWAWLNVVLGHSMGGKVALQFAESCARGHYGGSAMLPKQAVVSFPDTIWLWVLDSVSEVIRENSDREDEKVLSNDEIDSHPPQPTKWLVDHMIELGFSKSLSEWIGTNLKKQGDHETWAFNLDGVGQMFKSLPEKSHWHMLEQPPKDMEIAVARAENSDH
ncbi:alpha/beta-Hydrolases superfamily protein, partial [Prunus dulcis]